MTEPNQAESHQSHNLWYILDEMISLQKIGKKFSDLLLTKTLGISPRTVQRIRKQLLDSKIIQRDSKTYPNNEKFYKIIDLKKAEQKSERAWTLHMQNSKEQTGKYYQKYGIRIPNEIPIEFEKKTQNIKNLKNVLKKDFLNRICPICGTKTLRDYTKGQKKSLVDRRCNKCHFTFLYHYIPTSIQAVKY